MPKEQIRCLVGPVQALHNQHQRLPFSRAAEQARHGLEQLEARGRDGAEELANLGEYPL